MQNRKQQPVSPLLQQPIPRQTSGGNVRSARAENVCRAAAATAAATIVGAQVAEAAASTTASHDKHVLQLMAIEEREGLQRDACTFVSKALDQLLAGVSEAESTLQLQQWLPLCCDVSPVGSELAAAYCGGSAGGGGWAGLLKLLRHLRDDVTPLKKLIVELVRVSEHLGALKKEVDLRRRRRANDRSARRQRAKSAAAAVTYSTAAAAALLLPGRQPCEMPKSSSRDSRRRYRSAMNHNRSAEAAVQEQQRHHERERSASPGPTNHDGRRCRNRSRRSGDSCRGATRNRQEQQPQRQQSSRDRQKQQQLPTRVGSLSHDTRRSASASRRQRPQQPEAEGKRRSRSRHHKSRPADGVAEVPGVRTETDAVEHKAKTTVAVSSDGHKSEHRRTSKITSDFHSNGPVEVNGNAPGVNECEREQLHDQIDASHQTTVDQNSAHPIRDILTAVLPKGGRSATVTVAAPLVTAAAQQSDTLLWSPQTVSFVRQAALAPAGVSAAAQAADTATAPLANKVNDSRRCTESTEASSSAPKMDVSGVRLSEDRSSADPHSTTRPPRPSSSRDALCSSIATAGGSDAVHGEAFGAAATPAADLHRDMVPAELATLNSQKLAATLTAKALPESSNSLEGHADRLWEGRQTSLPGQDRAHGGSKPAKTVTKVAARGRTDRRMERPQLTSRAPACVESPSAYNSDNTVPLTQGKRANQPSARGPAVACTGDGAVRPSFSSPLPSAAVSPTPRSVRFVQGDLGSLTATLAAAAATSPNQQLSRRVAGDNRHSTASDANTIVEHQVPEVRPPAGAAVVEKRGHESTPERLDSSAGSAEHTSSCRAPAAFDELSFRQRRPEIKATAMATTADDESRQQIKSLGVYGRESAGCSGSSRPPSNSALDSTVPVEVTAARPMATIDKVRAKSDASKTEQPVAALKAPVVSADQDLSREGHEQQPCSSCKPACRAYGVCSCRGSRQQHHRTGSRSRSVCHHHRGLGHVRQSRSSCSNSSSRGSKKTDGNKHRSSSSNRRQLQRDKGVLMPQAPLPYRDPSGSRPRRANSTDGKKHKGSSRIVYGTRHDSDAGCHITGPKFEATMNDDSSVALVAGRRRAHSSLRHACRQVGRGARRLLGRTARLAILAIMTSVSVAVFARMVTHVWDITFDVRYGLPPT